jgi:hypothetical protein
MPKATTCRLLHRELNVEEAVVLRDEARRLRQQAPDFRCIDCGQPIRPHRSGGHAAAHFEHLERNENCPLGHRAY